jgi:hypothetical protein
MIFVPTVDACIASAAGREDGSKCPPLSALQGGQEIGSAHG